MAKKEKATCRSCGAAIIWATTEEGKRIPLNATRVRGYAVEVGSGLGKPMTVARRLGTTGVGDDLFHVSHFTTCPNATEHSKGGR